MSDTRNLTLKRTLNRHPYSDTLNRPASSDPEKGSVQGIIRGKIRPQILRKTLFSIDPLLIKDIVSITSCFLFENSKNGAKDETMDDGCTGGGVDGGLWRADG